MGKSRRRATASPCRTSRRTAVRPLGSDASCSTTTTVPGRKSISWSGKQERRASLAALTCSPGARVVSSPGPSVRSPVRPATVTLPLLATRRAVGPTGPKVSVARSKSSRSISPRPTATGARRNNGRVTGGISNAGHRRHQGRRCAVTAWRKRCSKTGAGCTGSQALCSRRLKLSSNTLPSWFMAMARPPSPKPPVLARNGARRINSLATLAR